MVLYWKKGRARAIRAFFVVADEAVSTFLESN